MAPPGATRAEMAARRAGGLVGAAVSRGWPVGVAAMTSYLLSWLTVLVTGHPATARQAAVYATLGALATTAAVYGVLRRPRDAGDWSRWPLFALAAALLWLAALMAGRVLVPVVAASPALGVSYSLVGALVLGGVLVPLVVAAAGAGPGRGDAPWWRRWMVGSRLRAHAAWLGRAGGAVVVWVLVERWAESYTRLLVPYPPLGSLLVGVVDALGWALAAGIALRPLSASPAGRGDPEAHAAPARPRLTGPSPLVLAVSVSATLAAGFGALAALGAARVQPALTLVRGLADAAGGSAAAGRQQPWPALRYAATALGEDWAAQAEMSGAPGHTAALMSRALWWAPQATAVLRADAWLAMSTARPGGGPAGAGSAGVGRALYDAALLARHRDPAGALQIVGMVARQQGRDGRRQFFTALSEDHSIALELPDGGLRATTLAWASDRVQSMARNAAGATVAGLDAHGQLAVAVAASGLWSDLAGGDPGRPVVTPTFAGAKAAADAHWRLGAPHAAEADLDPLFNDRSIAGSDRAEAARELLAFSAANGDHPDDIAALVSYERAQRTADDLVALGGYELATSQDAAEADLTAATRLPGTTQARATAWALLGLRHYEAAVHSDGEAGSARLDQQAIEEAQQALRIQASGQPALVAHSVLGNAQVALGALQGAGSSNPAPGAEALSAAGQTALGHVVGADPTAFILWRTLATGAAGRDPRAGLDNDLNALVTNYYDNASGAGRYLSVVNPTGALYGGGPTGSLVGNVFADIANLPKPPSPAAAVSPPAASWTLVWVWNGGSGDGRLALVSAARPSGRMTVQVNGRPQEVTLVQGAGQLTLDPTRPEALAIPGATTVTVVNTAVMAAPEAALRADSVVNADMKALGPDVGLHLPGAEVDFLEADGVRALQDLVGGGLAGAEPAPPQSGPCAAPAPAASNAAACAADQLDRSSAADAASVSARRATLGRDELLVQPSALQAQGLPVRAFEVPGGVDLVGNGNSLPLATGLDRLAPAQVNGSEPVVAGPDGQTTAGSWPAAGRVVNEFPLNAGFPAASPSHPDVDRSVPLP